MQLRAPKIMTMDGSVLKDHCVGVDGDLISYLLPIAEAPHDPQVIDLPHTTLLPGFVNAHCHLDLSHLCGKVSYTGSFTEWIQKMVTLRKHEGGAEIQAAAQALIQSGVTSVMDHVGAESSLADLLDNPLRRFMFLEVIGLTSEKAAAALAHQSERALEARRQGVFATPSPHAPYSLCAEVFRKIVTVLSPQPSPEGEGVLSIHCAESAEEWEMVVEGRGKLWEFVRGLANTYHPEVSTACHPSLRAGSQSLDPSASPQDDKLTYASPLQYLSKHKLLPRVPWLAVHCNTLTDEDIVLLKNSQATVVHCPRSHRHFSHPPFPIERLRTAGVPVAIGTDSLASCPNFNFLEELRALGEEFAFLTPEEILQMASHTSTLAPGNFADIIGLPQQNDLLNGPITFSMIGGKRVI